MSVTSYSIRRIKNIAVVCYFIVDETTQARRDSDCKVRCTWQL